MELCVCTLLLNFLKITSFITKANPQVQNIIAISIERKNDNLRDFNYSGPRDSISKNHYLTTS